jgi:hypothetical protein
MSQKRQLDSAREMEGHRAQLEMFSTAISAAEKAGDWDKVAQFTGLLGDYTQGGMGKKGKGKRDTALHSIADALKPITKEVSDYKPQDTSKMESGSKEAVEATRPRKIADLPKRTVTQSSFQAAQDRLREQDIEDEERKTRRAEKHDVALTERAAQVQAAIGERQKNNQERAAYYKANGKLNELAAQKMALDPELKPDDARRMAGEEIQDDRKQKQLALVDKHNKSVADLKNISSMIVTRAANIITAQQNAASHAKDAATRARHEGWVEKATPIKVGSDSAQKNIDAVNREIDKLLVGRAIVALTKTDPDTKKPMTDEEVAKRLEIVNGQIAEQERQRDVFGGQLDGYKSKYEALEREMGAAPLPESTIPKGLTPPPKRPGTPAHKGNDPMGIR